MSNKINFKVYGGCVSRDIFNFDDSDTLQLVHYHARSSLATIGSDNVAKKIPKKYYDSLSNIESKFQRRMVESDFDNEVIKSTAVNDYDFLLIDFLVDRLHLAEIDGKLVTRSVEFLRSGIKPDRVINTFSEQYFKLWKEGVNNLFNAVSNTVGLEAVRINKVYWTNVATNSQDSIVLNEKWDIEKNNAKLAAMYEHVEKILPSSSIIEIDKELLIADSDHKWGLSPFHFTDDYYRRMVNTFRG
ncbi:DUF6270 domain-containing protein [Psychrobacter sp. ASPA161_6]|uniref:DUF6270 domain-containing protein n=1 Tax=Psychrobacter sp. ASPA161_6 TaxID=3160962 RepID=UPI003F7ED588